MVDYSKERHGKSASEFLPLQQVTSSRTFSEPLSLDTCSGG
jgi:hypothetical protein